MIPSSTKGMTSARIVVLNTVLSPPRSITEVALDNVYVAAIYRGHHQYGCPRVTLAKTMDSIDHSCPDPGFDRYESRRVCNKGLHEWISLTRIAGVYGTQGRSRIEHLQRTMRHVEGNQEASAPGRDDGLEWCGRLRLDYA